ncbi:succinate dehydrogenase cytochrome b subunit [Candidatus Uabimicrobium sp. HlEnr_7]|uniref:succinate dehydrogenase cytochrome b subunit n=1 Tax=Candidatus Uabimicrobium helgolandensis TaxID=3095367 RepID=UPI003558E628
MGNKKFLSTSVGKKVAMAITGQCFCAFLVVHLAGNLTLFLGQKQFDMYAGQLEKLPMLVYPAEAVLILLALFHIGAALKLTLENKSARPVGYAVYKSKAAGDWASSKMFITGVFILGFLVLHLIQFKFGERPDGSLYNTVFSAFTQPLWVGVYVAFIAILSTHLSHGFQSAFQSLGINHPKYTPIIKKTSYVYAFVMWAGYTSIPLWIFINDFVARSSS